jgi:hypothetical protein
MMPKQPAGPRLQVRDVVTEARILYVGRGEVRGKTSSSHA